MGSVHRQEPACAGLHWPVTFASMSFLRANRAAPLWIAALVLLAYWRVTTCGFIWDDDDYVTQNPVLRTWGGIWRIWFEPTSLPQYYPLVHTSFWLEYRLWGPWAPGYHLVNVVLHAWSAWLLLRFGRRLALPGALFGALWFAVHPVHVESVAWITERKNVLSLLCYLLAAGRWLRWHDDGGKRDYAVGSVWFLCALLSKTVTASLPAALLVLLWWRDGRLSRRGLLGALPWFLAGAGLGWFTVHLEATHVGAANAPWQLVGAERLLVAGRACWFYAFSLVWPFATCFNYPRWQLDPSSWLQWAYPVGAVLLVALALVLHRRIGRGLAATLLLFGGTLVPAIGFFDVYPFRYSFVADHFQYHASLSVLMALAAFFFRRTRPLGARIVGALAVAWLAAMAVTSMLLIPQYKDFETLWIETLRKNPDSALALSNLGGIATDRRDFEAARDYLQRALDVEPSNAEVRNNLGVIAYLTGDPRAAEGHYRDALKWKPRDPNARNNLAVLMLDDGRKQKGLALAREAVEIDPDYYQGHLTLARALRETGRFGDALRHYEWVLQRTPGAVDARKGAVRCLLGLGKASVAGGNALRLLSSHPDDVEARGLLATALARALSGAPVEKVRAMAVRAIQNGGVDPDPILPLLAEELAALGEEELARAVRSGG